MLCPRPIIALLAIATLAGCKTPYKESDEKREAAKKNKQDDPTFQAFVGRLRIAVQKKDYAMLQSMMTSNFGYRWDDPQPGDSVFTYWSMHNLWPTLHMVLELPFAPHESGPGENYMVAVQDESDGGYAAGIKMVNGSWRFAYFVPPAPPEQPQQ